MEVLLGKSSVNPADIKWSDFNEKNCPYMVRQLPGKDNPLGVVKFLFPNTYNIYLHDSPAKQYFDRQNRTFSHGCIRVGEPLALMQWVLQDEKQITPDRIQSIFETGKETYLNLKQGIPVTIAYYTAWIDENGYINYTDDVYKLDEAMKNILFLDGIKPFR
jgi:murein L,D-transpeptidase YcbB/YkuD